MELNSEYEAKTTHKLAAIFYHFYGNELTRAECPDCGNRLGIEKENAFKDIRLRFWRIFVRTTNGERYLPLKEFLFGGLFSVRGFCIVHTSAGEDLLMCFECQSLFTVSDVNDEINVIFHEGFEQQAGKWKKEVESNYRDKMEEKRPTDNFILPDGSQIGTGCYCVVVSWTSSEGSGSIFDILKIKQSNDSIEIGSIIVGNEVGFRTLLTDFEEVESSLIAMGSRNQKTTYEEDLFDRYSPHYFEFSIVFS